LYICGGSLQKSISLFAGKTLSRQGVNRGHKGYIDIVRKGILVDTGNLIILM